MAKKKPLPMSQEALGRHFGVTRETVKDWKRLGAPIGSQGPYDVDKIQKWVNDNLRRSKVKTNSPTDGTQKPLTTQLLEEQVLLKRAQRMREEILLKRDRGDVVPRAALEDQANRLGEAVRTRFMGLPNAIASELNPAAPGHAREVLAGAIRDVLEELSIHGDGGD